MLTGKGLYIWKLKDCEGGNLAQMVSEASAAGVSHVLVKILDGTWYYNLRPYYDSAGNLQWADDLLPPMVEAFHSVGIQVWGWQYIYLENPALEGQRAVQRVSDLGLDGFVIDAEKEVKGQPAKSQTYVDNLTKYNGGVEVPVAFSSYRYPTLHPEIPYKTFLKVSQYIMPQMYWEGAHNPGSQLTRCVSDYVKLSNLPMIPTGSAYRRGAWQCTPADLVDFMDAAKMFGLPGVNFWVWNDSQIRAIPGLWGAFAGYQWGNPQPPTPPPTTVPLAVWARDYVNPFLSGLGYTGPAPE